MSRLTLMLRNSSFAPSSFAHPQVARLAGGVAAFAILAALGGTAAAESSTDIPKFASADFGWQSNLEDWEDPPPGLGHGPVKNDPAHPFVSNLQGGQTHTQVTKRYSNVKDPVLKPWAAAQMQTTNDEVASGFRDIPFTAQARCYPGGVPGQLLWPFEPVYFIQTPKEVWMIWQRDHWVRRVFLAEKHADHVPPSWFGELIGHYENGDTLVVDTIGLSTNNSYVDNFRTPHTERLHVVERFTIEPGGKNMKATVTVEDPDAFNAPLMMTRRWFKSTYPFEESICAENNVEFPNQNLFPIPEAKDSDF